MNITSAGIGSGLDLEGIIEAYVNAEAIPTEVRLQKKQESISLELSGVGSFKSALSTFNATLKKLKDPDAFNKQIIDVSTSAVEVDTNGFASNGSFDIEVQQLATGSRLQSQTFTDSLQTVGSGTLTFAGGSDSFDVTIDAADTLSDIRDKVNEQSENFGVTANIINTDTGSFLVYSSTVTGAANSLTVTSSDASLDSISINATVEQAAQDAIISIDGNVVTNDSNVFKNSIEDVTITAKQVNTGNPATLDISQDSENASELINEFIDGFNALKDHLVGLAAPELGRLAFDPNVRQVQQQMAKMSVDTVDGISGAYSNLTDIGISLNKEGRLEVSSVAIGSTSDKERLDKALEFDLKEVGELFASDDGVATQMSDMIDSYINASGALTEREKSLNVQLKEVEQGYEDLETRLRSYEDTLRKRFTFLDQTVSQYNATGAWLEQTLKNMQPKDS